MSVHRQFAVRNLQLAMSSSRSGPVSRVLSRAIISLGRLLPAASARPTRESSRDGPPLLSAWSCSRWGLPCRACHQDPRCALTAPFHPCLCGKVNGRLLMVDRAGRSDSSGLHFTISHQPSTINPPAIGGLFSVALSRSSRTVDVIHHRVLWSPDFPPREPESSRSDRSAHSRSHYTRTGRWEHSPAITQTDSVENSSPITKKSAQSASPSDSQFDEPRRGR